MEKNNENMKCLICGGDLCWDSDTNASDYYDEFNNDDVATIHYAHCLKCGRDYEICDPPKEERETSYKDYWLNNL